MPISREQFQTALMPDEFIDRMEVNRDRFLQFVEANSVSDEDRAFFSAHPVAIAAFGEDWCTDVIQFLPVVVRLARDIPEIELRIFERDDHLDLMEPYFKDGIYHSIPTFVFYDADWRELGHFVERPDRVTTMMAEETRRFALENQHLDGINRTVDKMPDETKKAVRENSARFRWDSMLEWNRIFLDDIKGIIAGSVVTAR